MEFERVHLAEPAEQSDPQPFGLDDLDMFADPIEAKVKVQRDGKGRPYVVPPEGGKRKAYARCTTFVGCLEDQYTVHLWQQRMTAIGLADRPDLLLSVAAHRDDREELNAIVERAREAAKANTGATTGTALHLLCEQVDRGENPRVPPAYADDLKAYRKATEMFNMVSIEQFCVYDPYGVAGTPDRIIEFMGRYYVGDIKTGTIDFGQLKFAMQFATYAHSRPYDFVRGPGKDVVVGKDLAMDLRGEWPGEVDTSRALLIHLPQGTGTCTVYWVDIASGWDAVKIAAAVRAWRNRKDLVSPFDLAAERVVAETWVATTVDEIRQLYVDYVGNGGDSKLILTYCEQAKTRILKLERDRRELAEMKRTGRPA